MYHLGNLLSNGTSRDDFGQTLENLTYQTDDPNSSEKYGFGVLGGGLFGVSNPNKIPNIDKKSGVFIQSIDLSKYNMYFAETEDRAIKLIQFLSQLQKYAVKTAVPNYDGFNVELKDVSVDSLYDDFTKLFDASKMTKLELNNFITEMVTLLQQAGATFKDDTLDFANFDSNKDLMSSPNISTRLMTKLGYDGVSVAGTSLDDFNQGNVVYNWKQKDIVGFFNSTEQAINNYQQTINHLDSSNLNQNIELLKEYAQNAQDIINRLQSKIQDNPKYSEQFQPTIDKLNQYKDKLDSIISNTKQIGIDGNNNIDNNAIINQYSTLKETIAAIKDDASIVFNDFVQINKGINNAIQASVTELNNILAKINDIVAQIKNIQNDTYVPVQAKGGLQTLRTVPLYAYHYGNLDQDKRMVSFEECYADQVLNTKRGFGAFGTGTYFTTNPNYYNPKEMSLDTKSNLTKKFYKLDLTKYNMFRNEN
jgi:hypothetical protein